jgi:hypothetical protein
LETNGEKKIGIEKYGTSHQLKIFGASRKESRLMCKILESHTFKFPYVGIESIFFTKYPK